MLLHVFFGFSKENQYSVKDDLLKENTLLEGVVVFDSRF
tara:strand:+ start:454 stop:570 length:117 start_codon:yes stop_codon:yes gene_type:complete